MLVFLATSASSANIENNGGNAVSPIKASYELSSAEIEEVYYVDVAWGSFENTYKTNDVKVWNPETLKYEIKAGTPEWTSARGANTVSVTNHSNTDITAVISYTPGEGYGDISASFDKSVIALSAPAENSPYESAPKDSATFSLSGEFSGEAGDTVEVGTVTVSLVGAPVGKISVGADISYPIYEQGDGIYYASFTALEDTSESHDTFIEINNTKYYINEPHENRVNGDLCFHFSAGMEVNIALEKPDIWKKMTELYAGRSYTLIVNLSAMTASLTEN